MKTMIKFMLMTLLLTSPLAWAIGSIVEGPKNCKQCNMDRTVFAQSRMVIVYDDGTTVGVCSIHCAAVELERTRDKQVSSLMVADYTTKELVDAKTASWVIGGKKKGVMTSQAKWAFARAEDARKFAKENGGMVSSFNQALNAATLEVMDQGVEERAVGNEMLRELR